MDDLFNFNLMRVPLNWAIVTVMAAFAFIAAAILFPAIFIPTDNNG